jgi:hypothetical protein
MTDYKAQGKTFPTVTVDLKNTRGSQSPYVMLSRCTNLSGLAILRPFDMKKICCHPNEDLRREMLRLQAIHWQTLQTYGDQEQHMIATQALTDLHEKLDTDKRKRADQSGDTDGPQKKKWRLCDTQKTVVTKYQSALTRKRKTRSSSTAPSSNNQSLILVRESSALKVLVQR